MLKKTKYDSFKNKFRIVITSTVSPSNFTYCFIDTLHDNNVKK